MDVVDILYKEMKNAEYNTLLFGIDQARALSSGPFRLKRLRKMGHPYSRLAPNPPLPPGVINRQSGQFRDGWYIDMFYGGVEGGVSGRLANDTQHADYIEHAGSGSSRMIARPIASLLEKRMMPVRERNLELAIIKAIGALSEVH